MEVGSTETWDDGTEAYCPDEGSLILDFESVRLMVTDQDGHIFAGIVRTDREREAEGQGMATLSEREASWLAVQLMGVYFPDLHDMCQQVVALKRDMASQGLTFGGVAVEPFTPNSDPPTGLYL